MDTSVKRAPAGPWLTAARILAVLSVAAIVLIFVTAGRLVEDDVGKDIHGAGAIALHVTTGLWAVALALLAQRSGGPWWAPVTAALVFAASFLQAWLGEQGDLLLHVPGALVLTVGTVWVTAWLFLRAEAD